MKHQALLLALALIAACAPSEHPPDDAADFSTDDTLGLDEIDLDAPIELIGIDAGLAGDVSFEDFSFEDFAAALEKEAVFAEFDRNRDGLLDEAEFAAFVARGLDPFGTFERYDADRSGFITPDELSIGLFDALFGMGTAGEPEDSEEPASPEFAPASEDEDV